MKIQVQKQEPSMWNFPVDGVTQSMLTTFLNCPEKARLSYMKGLQLIEQKTEALDFGNVVHNCLDKVYSTVAGLPIQEKTEYIESIPASVKDMNSDYFQDVLDTTIRSSEMWLNTELVIELADRVMPHYFPFYKDDFTKYNFLALEEVFDVMLEVGKKSFRLRGKFDGIIEDFKGNIWLLETKTKGKIVEVSLMDKLSIDLQVNFYFIACYLTYGKYPSGVIYNIIRRPAEKRKVGESLNAFGERIEKRVIKEPEHYFKRITGSVTKEEIISFRTNLESQLLQLDRWWNNEFHYLNNTHCINGFVTCPFLRLCGQNQAQFYKKKEELFVELKANEEKDEN